jgi:hypothetical protein
VEAGGDQNVEGRKEPIVTKKTWTKIEDYTDEARRDAETEALRKYADMVEARMKTETGEDWIAGLAEAEKQWRREGSYGRENLQQQRQRR